MAIPSTVADLSTTAASNVPAGSDSTVSYPIDDMFRAHASIIAQVNAAKADLASPTFTGTVTLPTSWKVGSTTVTADGAELNILDGVTATAAELNVLDGITASTAELNYCDGVTSAIQTQLDSKLGGGATNYAMASVKTLTYYQLVTASGSGTTTVTPDFATGSVQTAAMGGTTTTLNLNSANFPAVGVYYLLITQPTGVAVTLAGTATRVKMNSASSINIATGFGVGTLLRILWNGTDTAYITILPQQAT